jgi:hypothetical protein
MAVSSGRKRIGAFDGETTIQGRWAALVLVAASLALAGINVETMREADRFYPALFPMAGAVLLNAPLIAIVGRPIDDETGKPPRWFQIASIVVALVGLGLGFWANARFVGGT